MTDLVGMGHRSMDGPSLGSMDRVDPLCRRQYAIPDFIGGAGTVFSVESARAQYPVSGPR